MHEGDREGAGGAVRGSERSAVMMLGVVVERRAVDHPWQKWGWRAVSLIPGAAPVAEWRLLRHDGECARYHAATLPLEIHRTDTEAYKYNLSGRPAVYVVMRETEDGTFPWQPVELTVSPWDAQAHNETAEDRIEVVPMPEPVIAWLKDFVDRHHVDRPFLKRRRKGRDRAPHESAEFVPLNRERG